MAFLNLSQKPRIFTDTETSGLNPNTHEIIDFAAIKQYPDGELETLAFKIKPRRVHLASPEALEVNGYNEEEWSDARTIDEAAIPMFRFMKDCIIVGHNVRFDIGFINAFLIEAGILVRVDYHVLDTMTLAYAMLQPKGLESLNLHEVCKFLGIPPEPTQHRALAGASSCKAVYDKLTASLPK